MILPIVEGHGEVQAVPVLIRRVLSSYAPDHQTTIGRPIRVKRNGLVQQGGIEHAIEFAAQQCGKGDGLLVLLDADDDLPCELGPRLLERATAARADRAIRVVAAMREFEAWFLAAARSLRGHRGFPDDLEPPAAPEAIRDAKGWLAARTPRGRSYRPTVDQAALAAVFDLHEAHTTSSFQKFVRDVVALASTP